MNLQSLAWVAVFGGLVLAPESARADSCCGGEILQYTPTVSNNTVTVSSGSLAHCTSTTPLLRQNEADGSVVSITSCGTYDAFADAGVDAQNILIDYMDECVPPGVYRYGAPTPIECNGCIGGNVPLFTEVTVTSALATDCTRTTSTAPTLTTTVPPWVTGPGDAGVIAYKTCTCNGEGCFCTVPSHPHTGVRAMMLATLGIGLVIIGLRARRRARKLP